LIDRVIKGARPGDLPFEIVRWPELVVNLRVARAIDVTIRPKSCPGRISSSSKPGCS
jgi:putative ABC transport system substrate-binding protein